MFNKNKQIDPFLKQYRRHLDEVVKKRGISAMNENGELLHELQLCHCPSRSWIIKATKSLKK